MSEANEKAEVGSGANHCYRSNRTLGQLADFLVDEMLFDSTFPDPSNSRAWDETAARLYFREKLSSVSNIPLCSNCSSESELCRTWRREHRKCCPDCDCLSQLSKAGIDR